MITDPIIFFDIDDTIRDAATGKIPDSAAPALERLREQGYTLCIATGRNFKTVPPDIRRLYRWDYYVCSNGHVVADAEGNIVFKKIFPEPVVRECIRISEKTGVTIEMKTEEDRFILKPADQKMTEAFRYFKIPLPRVLPYTGQPVISILIFPDRGRRVPEFDLYDAIDTFYGENNYCDISLRGINKASGAREVLKRTGYRQFIAVGDSFNDLEMIRDAAPGIAMGNAHPDIREAADYVTGRIEQDGLAQAVDFILQKGGFHGR